MHFTATATTTMIFDTEFSDFSTTRSHDYLSSQLNDQSSDVYENPDTVMNEGYVAENNDSNNFSINPTALTKLPEFGEESSSFRMPLEHSDDNIFKSNSPYAPMDQFTIPGYDLKTVVPSEAMIKSPEDSYYGQRLGNAPFSGGMDSELQFYIDPQETYSANGPMPFDTFENPEDDYDDDEDEDDDENDYDDDDLYSPESESLSFGHSFATTHHLSHTSLLPQQPFVDEDEDSAFNETSHDSLVVSRGRDKKRVASAGPHRCELVNHSTGEICNKVFSRPYDLIRHQDTIHATVRKTFKCDLCGDASKTFSRLDALSRHIRVKHS